MLQHIQHYSNIWWLWQEKWFSMLTRSSNYGRAMRQPIWQRLRSLPLLVCNTTGQKPMLTYAKSKLKQPNYKRLIWNYEHPRQQQSRTQPKPMFLKPSYDTNERLVSINGRQNNAIDELWTPNNPFDLNNMTWLAIVKNKAIFEALINNSKTWPGHANSFCIWPHCKSDWPFQLQWVFPTLIPSPMTSNYETL